MDRTIQRSFEVFRVGILINFEVNLLIAPQLSSTAVLFSSLATLLCSSSTE